MTLENECVRVELDATTGGFHSILGRQLAHAYIAVPDGSNPQSEIGLRLCRAVGVHAFIPVKEIPWTM